jgi:hypothetical protein
MNYKGSRNPREPFEIQAAFYVLHLFSVHDFVQKIR